MLSVDKSQVIRAAISSPTLLIKLRPLSSKLKPGHQVAMAVDKATTSRFSQIADPPLETNVSPSTVECSPRPGRRAEGSGAISLSPLLCTGKKAWHPDRASDACKSRTACKSPLKPV